MADIDERWIIDVDMKNVANDLNKFTGRINAPGRVAGRNPSQAGGFVKPEGLASKINRHLGGATSMIPIRGAKIKVPKPIAVRPPRVKPRPVELPPVELPPVEIEKPMTLAELQEQMQAGFMGKPGVGRNSAGDLIDELGNVITRNPMLENQVFDKAKTIQLRIK